ncbi:MAG: septum formation initiator family protein [Bosea sp. (in: a-proteobacteria)]|uniref:FtsB family cell division protein n=1 Tax=Bosea sp. (in: a-proteobacteria) TaxID=1871050 RepID=UPI0027331B50|nr:septum formation initiator family protein [Bosea sp. (in: a-proteobacteria)]MDP3255675.1 septum formation initiator family protein [Bosea sp. (in: a-proteobacteria)]MDP3318793.1 septum formation initiator family protein [Bosea sp. (in: a-proteobacteria)]
MVIRRGVRSVLITLALYLVSGAAVSYFLFHAQHGSRGLDARDTLKDSLRAMEVELATLTTERKLWENRLSLVRDEAVDRDVLEERARDGLGRVHKNDVILMGR